MYYFCGIPCCFNLAACCFKAWFFWWSPPFMEVLGLKPSTCCTPPDIHRIHMQFMHSIYILTIELPVNWKDDGFVEAQKKKHNKHNGNITPNHCFQHAPSLKTKVKWSSSQVGLNLKNKTHVGKWNHQLHNIHPNVWSSIVSANLWPKRFGVRRHSSRTSDPNTPIAAGPTGVWLLQCDLHQWHSPKE